MKLSLSKHQRIRPASPARGTSRVNTLWSSDTMCRHRSASTLAQVMACCLMAPNHYLNQFDLSSVTFSEIHLRAITQEVPQPSIPKISFKMTYIKFQSNLPGGQLVDNTNIIGYYNFRQRIDLAISGMIMAMSRHGNAFCAKGPSLRETIYDRSLTDI